MKIDCHALNPHKSSNFGIFMYSRGRRRDVNDQTTASHICSVIQDSKIDNAENIRILEEPHAQRAYQRMRMPQIGPSRGRAGEIARLSLDASTQAMGMPRSRRLDFPGAIHFVQVHGQPGPPVFFDPACLQPGRTRPRGAASPLPLRQFEHLLTTACDEYNVILYGYCMEPNDCVLVLQTAGASLDAFMRQLCGQYAKYLLAGGTGSTTSVFRSRYESRLLAPEYLPHAVRRAHCSPVVNAHALRRSDYPFSSDHAHSGGAAPIPIDKARVKSALELRGHFGPRGYREFMDQPESPYVATLFARGSPLDSRIVGNKVFVQQAHRTAAHPPPPPTAAELIAGVAHLLGVTVADIHSATPSGVLGRALVAWYGLRSGAATLTEMGRWFSVTGATLGQGMAHHRKARPDLFGHNF